MTNRLVRAVYVGVILAVAVVIQRTVMGASSTRTFLFVVIISGCGWGREIKPGCWEQVRVVIAGCRNNCSRSDNNCSQHFIVEDAKQACSDADLFSASLPTVYGNYAVRRNFRKI